jgi:hypothetical protein
LCAALDLEGFLGRDSGEFEVVGAVGGDVCDAGHGLDRQGDDCDDGPAQVGATEALEGGGAFGLFAGGRGDDFHYGEVLFC